MIKFKFRWCVSIISILKWKLMKNFFIALSIALLGISISSCTKAEIEKNANEAGNVVGKTLKGVSSGFIDGLKGKDE